MNSKFLGPFWIEALENGLDLINASPGYELDGRVSVVNAVGGLKEILCNVQPFNPFDSIDVHKLGRTNGNKCCLM